MYHDVNSDWWDDKSNWGLHCLVHEHAQQLTKDTATFGEIMVVKPQEREV